MIDLLAMIDDPDGEYWSLVRFREQITETMFLVECLNTKTGENPTGSYVLDLHVLMLQPGDDNPRARIFDDFDAVRAFLDWVEEPAAEKVVKLVKS